MSGKAKDDLPGAGILGDVTRVKDQALQFIRLAHRWSQTERGEYHLRSLTLYPPSATRAGSWMVVGKAWYGGYKLVAFHRSTDALSVLLGFLARWSQGKLDWKRDQYDEKTALEG